MLVDDSEVQINGITYGCSKNVVESVTYIKLTEAAEHHIATIMIRGSRIIHLYDGQGKFVEEYKIERIDGRYIDHNTYTKLQVSDGTNTSMIQSYVPFSQLSNGFSIFLPVDKASIAIGSKNTKCEVVSCKITKWCDEIYVKYVVRSEYSLVFTLLKNHHGRYTGLSSGGVIYNITYSE